VEAQRVVEQLDLDVPDRRSRLLEILARSLLIESAAGERQDRFRILKGDGR